MTYRSGAHGSTMRSTATRRARLNAKWQRIVQYSIDGVSIEEAAQILNIKVDSLQRLVKMKTGTRAWPIAEDYHPFNGTARSSLVPSVNTNDLQCSL